jgi:hypothetical protein
MAGYRFQSVGAPLLPISLEDRVHFRMRTFRGIAHGRHLIALEIYVLDIA